LVFSSLRCRADKNDERQQLHESAVRHGHGQDDGLRTKPKKPRRKRVSLWKQQREHICFLEGIDPEAFDDAVRRKTRKLVEKWRKWDYELAD
jgi:hypothetical protein